MKITRQNIHIDGKEHPEIIFLRVKPKNLQVAIRLVLHELAEKSWLNELDDKTLKKSLRMAADKTVQNIELKIKDKNGDNDAKKAGQYLVSYLSKRALVTELDHKDIPLLELLSRRMAGGEGFDFYSEKLSDSLIVCGEAKFVTDANAYNDSIKQIKNFIDQKKHILDIQVIVNFTSESGRKNMIKGQHGVCAAFSCTNINTEKLIENIKKNINLPLLFDKSLIILVAVEVA